VRPRLFIGMAFDPRAGPKLTRLKHHKRRKPFQILASHGVYVDADRGQYSEPKYRCRPEWATSLSGRSGLESCRRYLAERRKTAKFTDFDHRTK
jgi:hypothetical protein